MADDRQWYYAADGQRVGPVGENDLRALAARGQVTADTLVWSDGMMDWQPLRLSPLAGLASATFAASSAPPLPSGEGGPGAPMGMVDTVISCLNKYVQFSGRSSRSEYWYFQLFGALCSILIGVMVGRGGGGDVIGGVVSLVLFLPQLAVGVRRLHDTDRSGWWLLIMLVPLIGWIVLLVFLCTGPTPGRNRFG